MFYRLLQNHVLANLTFILVLVVGFLSYQALPRQQDPTINFNWISIITQYPGASASDVEKRITDVLEDAIDGIPDLRFVSSTSRENVSSILVRFEDLNPALFEKRLADMRRELQNAESLLPDGIDDPQIVEITSGNAYPAATVAITSIADDENLRIATRNITQYFEQMSGIDRVDTVALNEPELLVRFEPDLLEQFNLTPGQISDTIRSWFQDIAAGTIDTEGQNWLVSITGKTSDPEVISQLPIVDLEGEVPISRVATVERTREKASEKVRVDGNPAVLLAIMKQDNTNIIELLEHINAYLISQNTISDKTGIKLILVDDGTPQTLKAINIMQSNALIGLSFVLLVAWLFLGLRIAFLTAIGIPFILAGTFWILSAIGQTLNVTVLLGVVIVLGMLVDDAVVVVESIYYRMQRGMDSLEASVRSLQEVAQPVTTAVLTTISAFLPLMLLPGILGKFMLVVPLVVTIALLLSLVEAFWMLPAHVASMGGNMRKPGKIQQLRSRAMRWIRHRYSILLIYALRWPKTTLSTVMLLFFLAIGILAAGLIKVNFFAADTLRLFYVNVEMAATSTLDNTLNKTLEIEQEVKKHLQDNEARSVVSYAGQMFTETEPLFGNRYGQIIVGLKPDYGNARRVEDIVESMRKDVTSISGADNISFLTFSSGPPASKPISVKIRGDDFVEINRVAEKIKAHLETIGGIDDIADNATSGRMELSLSLNHDAVRLAGINPNDVMRTISLLIDGEIVADMQDQGEKLRIRLRANQQSFINIDDILDFQIPTANRGSIALSELTQQNKQLAVGNIRHHNFRRSISVEADLKKYPNEDFYTCQIEPQRKKTAKDYSKCSIDTVTANAKLLQYWNSIKAEHPSIDLDFSGQLDDINESIDAMGKLFLIGIGLMYLILGTQFKSYFQPLLILATIPMAFAGVIFGLLFTQSPLSLYTLYGVVALAGIAVNSAIVLISAANDRRNKGMGTLHAIIFASRRRVIPIIITTLTTIAGLFSLAMGLGGKSLIWGPVGTAIVWGVGFSSVLSLFTIPSLYLIFVGWKERRLKRRLALSKV
ncbi:MAG: RND multidrug efflux transporter; Acriflavin resistance protein [uncultured Thiotrichaceae bacterium]|uniref:RND multidrug efflux transporter Acriflavin resistance protein n=1 Tax=uncultured Thiotrichaceae bacterium TaxID=298394 RepID=A0A6S6U0M7_9GAMM|nr:MAG: RND multidrug efflux transporter; Acriflavin resistance protein [uncultured Thiotrichaceae bacterium]